MQVKIEKQENTYTVFLEGRLDTAASPQTETDMQPLFLLEEGEIILDCSQLTYISSSGLRIFLALLKKSKAKGVKLYIRGLNETLRNVFTMTGFFHLFEFKH